jgi:hypothetical protein
MFLQNGLHGVLFQELELLQTATWLSSSGDDLSFVPFSSETRYLQADGFCDHWASWTQPVEEYSVVTEEDL